MIVLIASGHGPMEQGQEMYERVHMMKKLGENLAVREDANVIEGDN